MMRTAGYFGILQSREEKGGACSGFAIWDRGNARGQVRIGSPLISEHLGRPVSGNPSKSALPFFAIVVRGEKKKEEEWENSI